MRLPSLTDSLLIYIALVSLVATIVSNSLLLAPLAALPIALIPLRGRVKREELIVIPATAASAVVCCLLLPCRVDPVPLLAMLVVTYLSARVKIPKRVLTALAVLAFALVVAPVAEVAPIYAGEGEPKEIGNEIIIDPSMDNGTIRDMLTRLARDAPGSWIKLRELRWDLIEPEKGTINRTVVEWYKHWISFARELGLKVMVIIASTTGVSIANKRIGVPDWVPWEFSDEGIEAYVSFVKWAVGEFGSVLDWQIGNEMDLTIQWHFSRIFPRILKWYREVSKAVKEANPSARVYVNLVYGLPCYWWLVEELCRIPYIDYIGPDLYFGSGYLGYASEFYRAIERTYDVLSRHGKKVWAAEIGYPTGYATHGEESQYQALKDILACLQRSHAEKIFYCRVFEQPDELYRVDTLRQPTGRWDHGLALITNEGHVKKAYEVYVRAANGEVFEPSARVLVGALAYQFLCALSVFNSVAVFLTPAVYSAVMTAVKSLLYASAKKKWVLRAVGAGLLASAVALVVIGGAYVLDFYFMVALNAVEVMMFVVPLYRAHRELEVWFQ